MFKDIKRGIFFVFKYIRDNFTSKYLIRFVLNDKVYYNNENRIELLRKQNIKVLIHESHDYICEYQLKQWIPLFVDEKCKFAIIVSNELAINQIRRIYKNIPILYLSAGKIINLVQYIPTLKCIFYISFSHRMLDITRISNLRHIFLGHGDSEKSASVHKNFRIFDEMWVASQGHIDRFKNAKFSYSSLKFEKIGRPQLFNIIKYENINSNLSSNIIYAPTWEGVHDKHNYSSVPIADKIIDLLSLYCTYKIILKLHPLTGTRVSSFLKQENKLKNKYLNSKFNFDIVNKESLVCNLIANAEIFVCDISSVVTDFLCINKPIFVYIPDNSIIERSYSKIPYDYYTYTFSDINELRYKIKRVLHGDDWLKINRHKASECLLGRKYILENKFSNLLKI